MQHEPLIDPGSAKPVQPQTGVVTLLFTDIVSSTALKQRLGDKAGAALIQQHHALVRQLLETCPGADEIETAGDSFLLSFLTPSDAVKFSLVLQGRLRALNQGQEIAPQDRIGIHLGEVVIERHDVGYKPKDLYGLQIDTCSRVMSLAKGGQVLMSRGVFDSARQVLKGEDIEGVARLEWLNHGPYLLKGLEEPVEICEVRETGQEQALGPPTTSEKAQRQVRPDEESVLGWRPAVGQEVPNTPWILEEKLGEGGFGEVWVGRHQKLKERRVFKFCFRADRVRSLKREMTLFRLLKEHVGDHPNIVRLHEVYLEEAPFYLEEEYVEGKDLKTWCEARGGAGNVPLEVRLEMIAQAAEALQAAHDAGIIHRDVKPGNILISNPKSEIRNPKLEVKLTDFGIGQVISAEYLAGVTKAGFTQTMLGSSSSGTGTALYLAPEIIAGIPATTRSDIYSLGVVCYQLLVGDFRRPLTADWPKQVADPLLREDLERCFAWNPEERFTGVAELARQLRRLGQRQAELADHDRLARLARRRERVALGSACAAAILLLLACALGYGLKKAKAAQLAAYRSAYVSDMNLAAQAIKENDRGRAVMLLDRHRPRAADEDLRGWEWRWLRAQCLGDDAFILGRHEYHAYAVAFLPGDRLASGSFDGTLKLWDLKTRRLLQLRDFNDQIWGLTYSPSRQVLAVVTCNKHEIHMVDPETLQSRAKLTDRLSQWDFSVAFSPDGRLLAAGGASGFCLWDTETLHERRRWEWSARANTRGPFSPDGQFLALPSGKSLRVWDLRDDREIASSQMDKDVTGVAFSPDGELLAFGCEDRKVRISNATNLASVATLTNHTDHVVGVTWSPDGRQLVSFGADQVIRLWDRSNWTQTRVLQGHESQVSGVQFSPDGRYLASASKDGTVRIWDVKSSPQIAVRRPLDAAVRWKAVSPGGAMVLGEKPDGVFVVWDAVKQQPHAEITRMPKNPSATAVSDDGGLVVVGQTNGNIRFWDTVRNKETGVVAAARLPIMQLALSPDARLLAAAVEGDSASLVIDVGSASPLGNLSGFGGIIALRFSEDGATLFIGTYGPDLYAWDVKRMRVRAQVKGHREWISAISLASSARRLVTASADGTARIWDSESLKPIAALRASSTSVGGIGISPDGRRLVTWGWAESKGRLWDADTREQLGEIPPPDGAIDPKKRIQFSPDATTLIILEPSGAAELLTAPPLQELDALIKSKEPAE